MRANHTSARAHVRPARQDDAPTLAQVHAQTWVEAYSDLLPAQVIRDQVDAAPEQWRHRLEAPDGPSYWLAERDGKVVGFAWAEAIGPGHPRALELIGLYLIASEYGTGTAGSLLLASVGDAPCQLWVARDNARARAFYRRNGFAPDGAERVAQEWGGITVERWVR